MCSNDEAKKLLDSLYERRQDHRKVQRLSLDLSGREQQQYAQYRSKFKSLDGDIVTPVSPTLSSSPYKIQAGSATSTSCSDADPMSADEADTPRAVQPAGQDPDQDMVDNIGPMLLSPSAHGPLLTIPEKSTPPEDFLSRQTSIAEKATPPGDILSRQSSIAEKATPPGDILSRHTSTEETGRGQGAYAALMGLEPASSVDLEGGAKGRAPTRDTHPAVDSHPIQAAINAHSEEHMMAVHVVSKRPIHSNQLQPVLEDPTSIPRQSTDLGQHPHAHHAYHVPHAPMETPFDLQPVVEDPTSIPRPSPDLGRDVVMEDPALAKQPLSLGQHRNVHHAHHGSMEMPIPLHDLVMKEGGAGAGLGMHGGKELKKDKWKAVAKNLPSLDHASSLILHDLTPVLTAANSTRGVRRSQSTSCLLQLHNKQLRNDNQEARETLLVPAGDACTEDLSCGPDANQLAAVRRGVAESGLALLLPGTGENRFVCINQVAAVRRGVAECGLALLLPGTSENRFVCINQVAAVRRGVAECGLALLLPGTGENRFVCINQVAAVRRGVAECGLALLLPGTGELEQLVEVLSQLHYDANEQLSYEEISYQLDPSEVEILLREVAVGSANSTISQAQFIASQVDWRAFEANHREEWTKCLMKTFEDIDTSKTGRINMGEIMRLLGEKLPEEEVG
eukprot:gene12360-15541_t